MEKAAEAVIKIETLYIITHGIKAEFLKVSRAAYEVWSPAEMFPRDAYSFTIGNAEYEQR